jgi:translation initiation factor 2 beta subunit (eIF-2beta)/eIF-5
MPRLIVQVYSRKGGETVVVNGLSIARALCRNDKDIMQWLTRKTGARCSVKFDGGWIISGTWTQEQLSEWVDLFITTHVLCTKCKNPETIPTKGCLACGYKPSN